jgi:Protein of unknown function (DUF3261)
LIRGAIARLAVASALACGCATMPPPAQQPAADAYPGTLADSGALPDGLFLRQRIKARFGKRELSFAAVMQTDGGVLSLLALTPYGSRAFLIEQRGQQLSFTKYVDREMPFPPRFILLDVHRTFFLGLPGAPLADGEHSADRSGERITERWKGGLLLERSFSRIDRKPQGTIRIRYSGERIGGIAARQIQLENGWFGYHLSIETLADR